MISPGCLSRLNPSGSTQRFHCLTLPDCLYSLSEIDTWLVRVLSRIFSLGEKIRFEIDGECVCVCVGGGGGGSAATGWSFLGGSGGMPPQKSFVILSLVRVVLRYFKTVLRSW